jgi:hypothetical protein
VGTFQHSLRPPLDTALAGPRYLATVVLDNPQPRTLAQTANFNRHLCHIEPHQSRPATAIPSMAASALDESNCRMWESKIKRGKLDMIKLKP